MIFGGRMRIPRLKTYDGIDSAGLRRMDVLPVQLLRKPSRSWPLISSLDDMVPSIPVISMRVWT